MKILNIHERNMQDSYLEFMSRRAYEIGSSLRMQETFPRFNYVASADTFSELGNLEKCNIRTVWWDTQFKPHKREGRLEDWIRIPTDERLNEEALLEEAKGRNLIRVPSLIHVGEKNGAIYIGSVLWRIGEDIPDRHHYSDIISGLCSELFASLPFRCKLDSLYVSWRGIRQKYSVFGRCLATGRGRNNAFASNEEVITNLLISTFKYVKISKSHYFRDENDRINKAIKDIARLFLKYDEPEDVAKTLKSIREMRTYYQ